MVCCSMPIALTFFTKEILSPFCSTVQHVVPAADTTFLVFTLFISFTNQFQKPNYYNLVPQVNHSPITHSHLSFILL